jgi:hypothetical protein
VELTVGIGVDKVNNAVGINILKDGPAAAEGNANIGIYTIFS